MSTKKITALTELSAAPAASDMIPIVDVSDTTDAASGTTKKITATNVGKALGVGAGNTAAEPVKIDTSNGRVGIGTASPAELLELVTSSASGSVVQVKSTAADSYPSIRFVNDAREWRIYAPAGTISDGFQIYDATGTATRLFIDTSGNVGIGTTAPSRLLDVENSSGVATVAITSGTSSESQLYLGDTGDEDIGMIGYDNNTNSFRIVTNTATRLTVDTNGKVGIGTAAPDEMLEVETSSVSAAVIQIKSTGTDSYPNLRFVNDAREWRIYGARGNATDSFQIYDNTEGATRLRIDTTGNVLIGGAATPSSSVGNLCLFNGTIPSASVANGIVLYAEDATGSSELKVRDEAGNVATLSPHNFDLLGERSDPMAWSYSSKNAFVGKEVAVDMMKVVRALEKLTGESYIKMKDLPKSEVLDWDAEEKRKEDEQKVEVSAYKTRKVDADKEKSDFDDKWGVLPTGSNTKAEVKAFLDEQEIDYEDAAKDELLTKVPKRPEFTESEPETYVKKSKPDWM